MMTTDASNRMNYRRNSKVDYHANLADALDSQTLVLALRWLKMAEPTRDVGRWGLIRQVCRDNCY